MNSAFSATFDYVCHPLPCPRCAQAATDDCSIDLQTKVAATKGLRCLRVGDRIEIATSLQESGGYLELRNRHEPGRLSVIETWSCSNCGVSFLWAKIVFHDGILVSVEPVELIEATLSSADFISAEALHLFPMERIPEVRQFSPETLREELAAGQRALRT